MSNISVYEIKSGHYDYQHIWRSYPNSANGVTIRFKYKNNSTKTMKYVFLSFVPYNNVDDVVASDIGGFNQTRIKITGPIEPGMSKEGSCKNAFYNSSIVRCELVKAEIEYMDGTKESIDGKDIDQAVPQSTGGCYVATAVYVSYDCPQVWTLRRYRDYTLAQTWYGRAFIKTYYAISPTLVKWFGHTNWFRNMWKPSLDKMVRKLNDKGVSDTPYQDKKW